jgi:hypothetical protein
MRTVHASATLAALTSTAAITLLAACSSGSAPARSSTASPPAAAASESPSALAPQALAAYEAMWSDVQAVDVTSDYTNARLGAHLDGEAYMTISENMAANKASGIVTLGAPVLHPSVVPGGPTSSSVTIRDCLDDSRWLEYYAATHKLTDDIPGGHRYVTATVTDENGTWKVTTLDVRGEGTCT